MYVCVSDSHIQRIKTKHKERRSFAFIDNHITLWGNVNSVLIIVGVPAVSKVQNEVSSSKLVLNEIELKDGDTHKIQAESQRLP